MTDRKILYLVRHAKSSWSSADLTDFDRPLNKRGLRDAPEMGRRLKERKDTPDVILCSPARRAVQTLEQLNLEIGNVVYDDRIYGATTKELFDIIRSLSNRYTSAMIIGHNPSMTWLVNGIADTHIPNLPTCAVAILGVKCSHWAKIETGPGELLDFNYPKKCL